MQRYNFDRFRGLVKMAQGVAVHAETMEEAEKKASAWLTGDGDRIEFRNHGKCISYVWQGKLQTCPHCHCG